MPSTVALLSLLLYLSPLPQFALGDFVYASFNETLGLSFNGDAATTACEVGIDLISVAGFPNINGERTNNWGEVQGNADAFETTTLTQQGERSNMQSTTEIRTTPFPDSDETKGLDINSFGAVDDYSPSKTGRCPLRLRLTPSTPSKRGSVFRTEPISVINGFDVTFSIQMSDPSRTCTTHVDPSFGLRHHESCSVAGGDGLAFVVHNDKSLRDAALGLAGQGLGYSGINNALAVELDAWTNPPLTGGFAGPDAYFDDVFEDHVSVHSGGPTASVDTGSRTALGAARVKRFSDGKIHVVRIRYLPYLETEYFPYMTASNNLVPYIKDAGESRRIGTLVVYMDDGIVDDVPLLALPLNLGSLLSTDSLGRAYVGFTASTGRRWAKHDVLSWAFCSKGDCNVEAVQAAAGHALDYGQADGIFRARHPIRRPGTGYGKSNEGVELPLQQEWKDSTPWGEEPSRTASGFKHTLSPNAGLSVPPATPF